MSRNLYISDERVCSEHMTEGEQRQVAKSVTVTNSPFCAAGNHKLWELAQTCVAPNFGPASPEETRGIDFGIWARNSAARWRRSKSLARED
jgi:hypothetical protein